MVLFSGNPPVLGFCFSCKPLVQSLGLAYLFQLGLNQQSQPTNNFNQPKISTNSQAVPLTMQGQELALDLQELQKIK
jgi:hypothetical protein